MEPSEHHLTVARTARYYTLGESGASLREVWFVLHGHGQLAYYFLRHFRPCSRHDRLIVAPEALSRFHLEPAVSHATGKPKVGATWMTREDRLAEIDDYVGYLDALHAEVFARVDRAAAKVLVLGFSQGATTACRWLCRGRVGADTLVLWAGTLPAELDAESARPLRRTRMLRVLGGRDELAGAGNVETETAHLRDLGLDAPLVRFDGGHELSASVLAMLNA